MDLILKILLFPVNLLWFIIIIHVIMSWLINFQVLNLHQQLVAQIWSFLNALLEPIYRRIRRFIPPVSGVDLAPLVALFFVFALRETIFYLLYN